MRLARGASAVAAAAAACCCALAGDGKATLQDLRKQENLLRKELGTILRLRDEVAAGLAIPRAAATANGCLELTIGSAIGRQALTVRLPRRDGTWAGGVAGAAGYAPPNRADAAGVQVAGGEMRGVLTVTLVPYPIDGDYVDRPPVVRRYELDLLLKGEAVVGWAWPVGAGAAEPDAPALTCSGRFHPLRRPTFEPFGDAPLDTDPAGEGKWIEAQATMAYEQIRALELVQTLALPFDVAIRYVPRYRPKRPLAGAAKGTPARKGKHKRPPSIADVGLDDLGLEGGFGSDGGPAVEDYAPFVRQVRAMQGRVREMIELVEAWRKAPAEARTVQVGSLQTGDPDFGPYFGCEALPGDKARPNILPASVGADGVQSWPYVDAWRITGPLPGPGVWPALGGALPDIVPAFDAPCGADEIAAREAYAGKNPSPWETVKADPANGCVRPPLWHHGDKWAPGEDRYQLGSGLDWTSFYAFAEVHAERDCEAYLGVTVNDLGRLWIDGRLVWVGAEHRKINLTQTCVVKVSLRKGRNTLALRCDDRQHPSYFGVRVCARGVPRDAAAAAAAIEKRRRAYAALTSPTAGARGWRGNWHGQYPDARPVTAWDWQAGVNVLWRKPMMTANSTPVVAGDCVFTVDDPYFLVCVDKNTGKELWRRDCDVLELRNEAAYEETRPMKAELDKRVGKLLDLRVRLRELRRAGKDAAEAKQAHDAAAQEVHEVQRKISAHSSKGGGPSYSFMHRDVVGNAFATPVADGRHVWAKFGQRVVACFDLAGNRRWMVDTGMEGGGTGACPSLVLAGDRLIGLFAGLKDGGVVLALQAGTGKELWRTNLPGAGKWRTGSPVLTRLTDGEEAIDVVVTPAGIVLRAADGKVLLGDIDLQLSARKDYDTPIVDGDVIYLSREMARDGAIAKAAEVAAYRLILLNRDVVGAKRLWSNVVRSDFMAGLLAGDGVVYGLTNGPGGMGELWVLDAATGRARQPLRWVFPVVMGDAWVPPSRCGDLLVLADSWRAGGTEGLANAVSVVRTRPRLHVIARNWIDMMIGAPVFEGDRTYIRTRQALMCLAAAGEEGRRYEAEVNARTVLGELPLDRPDATPPLDVQPLKRRLAGAANLVVGEMVQSWFCVGPLPKALQQAAREKVGHPGWVLPVDRADAAVSVAGQQRQIRALGDWARLLHLREGHKDDAWPYGPRIDVQRTTKHGPDSVSYWYAPLHNGRDRTVRLELAAPGVSAWLSGVPVRHHQRLHLPAGYHALLLEIVVDRVPEGGLRMTPRFWASDDPQAELDEWLSKLRAFRPILQRAVEMVPDTQAGKTAARLLGQL